MVQYTEQKQRRQTQFNKVLIVGLGQLGLPVAKYVKKEEDLMTSMDTI